MENHWEKALLGLLYLICLAIETGLFLVLVARRAIEMTTAVDLIRCMLKVYLVPLGMIIGGIVSDRIASRSKLHASHVTLAFAVSIAWNALFLCLCWIYFASAESSPDTVLGSVTKLSPYANAAIATILVFVFGSPARGLAPTGDSA